MGQSGGPPIGGSVHIVQRGETLFSIAQRYGSTTDALAHANGLPDPRRIYVGQRLTIPGGGYQASLEETDPHVVQAGDTLTAIARRYRTTWQALARFNGMLSPDVLYAGQVIRVPAREDSASADSIGGGVHAVRAGEVLFRIALRYDVAPAALMSANQIVNPALVYPGQELAVPGEGRGLLRAPFVSADVQPLPVRQGSAVVVAVRTTRPVTVESSLLEHEVRFAEEGGVYYGLVGVHVFTEPGLYELTLTAIDSEARTTQITTDVVVEAEQFGYERIKASPGLLDPAVLAAERERLNALRPTFSQERRWSGSFQRPCEGTISSQFGTHRAYNDAPYTSYHGGVDFRGPTGTSVYAPAAGVVKLADRLTVRGGAVVIDHGWGVLTGYWHLSGIEVEVGGEVAQGDLIGRMGSTGLSTGSHLHWEMWVGGVNVNPLQWLDEFHPWPQRSGDG